MSAASATSDVFADQADVDFLPDDGAYDGLATRLTDDTSTVHIDDDDHDQPITSINPHFDGEEYSYPSPSTREARNSIRKSRGYLQNPFQDPDESNPHPHTAGPSASRSDVVGLSRQDTTSSTGPSHDYGRYQQGTSLTRAPTAHSVLTAQTTGRQSLHGPAHPYAMYPQNVDGNDLDDTASHLDGERSIPVGFPPSRYTQLNGHFSPSEQLPPYSEYPEDGAPKHVDTAAPRRRDSDEHASRPLLALPNSALSRPPQSMTDPSELASPTSTTTLLGPSGPKTWRQMSWKEKKRRKFFGVPFVWICVVGGIILFIAIVLAAVVGGYYSGRARGVQQAKYVAFSSTTGFSY